MLTGLFHPKERYLAADPRVDLRNIQRRIVVGPAGVIDGMDYPDDPRYLSGQGAGAPIFYIYQPPRKGVKGSIEYWIYRRHNDFRNMGLPGGVHHGDWERMSVLLDERSQPERVGYDHHGKGCSVPWDDARKLGGHPVGYSALGSGASYHKPGSYDDPAGPFNDLAGGKPGEQPDDGTPGTNQRTVNAEENLNDYRRSGLAGYDGHYGRVSSPRGPHTQSRHDPGSSLWGRTCEDPDDVVK
jgi:hypothetical protein